MSRITKISILLIKGGISMIDELEKIYMLDDEETDDEDEDSEDEDTDDEDDFEDDEE